eukprot:COSAG05_NODE_638_length_8163_cov_16.318452_7_plen_207_part_00
MELAATAQQRPRPKGRLRQSDRFKVVTYNMAAPSKMQLQLLDTLGYDCIFLPEVWDKAYKYMDYGGPKRFLVTEVAGRHDRPGAVAWRLSGYAATMLANWGTCPGAEARTCWLRFEIAGGRHLVVVGVYVPPDFRTNPTQEEVLEAVRKFLNGLLGRCLKLVTGDWNAQLLRNRDGQTGRWCLRNDIHKLNSAAKRKSSERLVGRF